MSRKAVLLLVFAAFSLPLMAADRGRTTVSILATDPGGVYSSSSGFDFNGGFGVGIRYSFTPRWSTELQAGFATTTVTSQTQEKRYPDGTVYYAITREHLHSNPVDLIAAYHFVNDTRWKPYIGAGLHYVDAPSGLPPRELTVAKTATELTGGTFIMFTPHFGLRLDAKAILRNSNPTWDRNVKGSFGVSWKF